MHSLPATSRGSGVGMMTTFQNAAVDESTVREVYDRV